MSTADDQGKSQSPSGPADPPPGTGALRAEQPGYGRQAGTPAREDEVSLLDILLVLARHKTLIVRTVLVFTLLGVTYALLVPEEYTSSAKVVRESQEDGSLPGGVGALGGLAGGAISGILGGASSGLTTEAFSDVLKSREVRLAVVRDTFHFSDTERPMTFVNYVNRPPGPFGMVLNYTLKLPWTLKDALGSAISGPPAPAGSTGAGEELIPSEEEDEALKVVSDKISASVDEETGIMTVSVTAGGPQLAASLTESFLDHFTTRVREIRTEKVRERLEFVEGRFEEAEQELEVAEEELAQFLERNQNPTTASLQFQRDRLQRQVSFKEQLYSELQSQLTQTRLDLQRRQPVVSVVEEPVPPIERSAPRRTLIFILSFILGGMAGIGLTFLRSFLVDRKKDPEDQKKLGEIRGRLLENGILGMLKRREEESFESR